MKLSTRLATGALVASMVAVPVSAEAAKPASAGHVRTQVRAADHSLDRVSSLVRRNRDRAAAKELRTFRRKVRGAEASSRRLRGATTSVDGAKSYGSAVRMVGSVTNDCADTLSGIVGQASGDPQLAIAQAISACITTRERVITALTALLDQVPEAAKPYIAQVIAMLSSDGQDEVQALTTVLDNPALPTDVASTLTHALELATAAIDDAMARIQGILDLVPAEVRPMLEGVLTMVTDQLHMVIAMVKDLFTSLFGGVPTSGSGTGLIGSGLPGLNLLQGIFGQGFPFNIIPLDLPFNISGFSFATTTR